MKTTNLKSKIMAGVLCATLVGGVGTAFAATDAGTQLGSWYNAKLTASKNALYSSVGTFFNKEYDKQLKQWKIDTKANTVNDVIKAGTDEELRATTAINKVKDDNIKLLEARRKLIVDGIEKQYDGMVSFANTFIGSQAVEQQKTLNEEIKTVLDTQGTTSLGNVTTNVGKAQTDAVKALGDKITALKAEIQDLITKEQGTADGEIKAELKRVIEAKQAEIITTTEALEKEKTDAITAKGADIERLAKDDLANLVADITKK